MNNINKLALIGGFRSLSGSIIWPYVGFALYKVYGLPLSVVSLFYLIQAFVNIIASISGGIITDYLGRKRSMALSILFSSLSLLLAYVVNMPLYVMVFILFQSFFNTVYNVSSTAIVGDMYKGTSQLIRAYSRQRVGINAGWALGPLIGGYIFTFFSFRTLLLISSLLVLIITPVIRILPDFKGVGSILNFNLSKQFLVFLIPTFLTFAIVGQLGFSILTYYNTILHFTEFEVGILFAINGLLIVAFQDLAGRLIGSKVRLISFGMVMYGLAYLAIAFITNLYVAMLDVVFITIAEMIVTPISQALANTLANNDTRGKQMGLYSMVTGLGRVIGSSVSSELMNYYLYYPLGLWGSISLFGFSSAVLYYIILRRLKSIVV
ncbi:MFS transporter [Sulfolobus acidocaldarius SUSAZ]|nr:MFS transporter [Sulfolobus acidocaldarius SUSAZ]